MDTAVPADLANDLLVSAFCRAIVWWLEHDAPCSPEELAHWFVLFVEPGAAGAR